MKTLATILTALFAVQLALSFVLYKMSDVLIRHKQLIDYLILKSPSGPTGSNYDPSTWEDIGDNDAHLGGYPLGRKPSTHLENLVKDLKWLE